MEKYENLAVVGEGSYGIVMKCRHRDTGQLVAIKKFLETEDDASIKKMALREVNMLKRLRHDNLVNLLEVFRKKRRFHLVFEFMDHTILDELEATGGGLNETKCREYIFQVVRGVDFCHSNNVIHRDIKPENVLVSSLGVIKLCDFGFARLLSGSGEMYTDYVATRWYRAPELLVPDTHYGKAVDIWAIGCLFAEMMAGDPLFPGDSDIDQLFLIMKVIGKPSQRHQNLIIRNPVYRGLKRCDEGTKTLSTIFPSWPTMSLDFLSSCLKMDPLLRPASSDLLRHVYLTKDNFEDFFLPELRQRILRESCSNPLLRKIQGSAPRKTRKVIDFNEEKARRNSILEMSKWRGNCSNDDMRRPSLELNRMLNSSRSRPEPMDISHEDFENRRSPSPMLTAHNVLQPSVSNLYFMADGPKRSPGPSTLKSNAINKPISRKLDRPTESSFSLSREPVHTPSPTPWMPTKRMPLKDGQSWKNLRNNSRSGMDEDFSLPIVPGATSSPKKQGKKKMTLSVKDGLKTPTPRNQHSLTPSAGSRSKLNPGFPLM